MGADQRTSSKHMKRSFPPNNLWREKAFYCALQLTEVNLEVTYKSHSLLSFWDYRTPSIGGEVGALTNSVLVPDEKLFISTIFPFLIVLQVWWYNFLLQIWFWYYWFIAMFSVTLFCFLVCAVRSLQYFLEEIFFPAGTAYKFFAVN